MSEIKTDDTELFTNSNQSESNTDDDSGTGEQESESSSEQDIDVQPKELTAEQQAQKQVDALTLKVLDGDIDLDNLPSDQKWMKKAVENKLKVSQRQPEVADLVAKEISKREDDKLFKEVKSSLSDMELNKSQKKQLQVELDDLMDLGAPKGQALQKALKIVGAKPRDIEQIASKKKAATIPQVGSYRAKDDELIKPDDPRFEKLSQDDKVKMYEKLRSAA